MATYAIGDIQGCLQPLLAILEKADFTVGKDKLWCVGDLVNRGPDSLETLRFIHSLGDAVVTVLGNHDLHLLAVAHSKANPKKSDTIDTILNAPDAEELLSWLRHQPLLYQENGYTLVHAGIPPQWTLAEAAAHAKEVENALQGPNFVDFLDNMYGNLPDCWSEGLLDNDRLRVITNYLTRMRFCTSNGILDLHNKLGPDKAPDGYQPWYAIENRKTADDKIIFGHWASLQGQCKTDNVFALDTGCVWGGHLTMMRLEDHQLFQCEC